MEGSQPGEACAEMRQRNPLGSNRRGWDRLRTLRKTQAAAQGGPSLRGQRPPAPLPQTKKGQRLRVAKRHQKVSVELDGGRSGRGGGKQPPGGPFWRPQDTPSPTVDPTPPPTTTALSNAAPTRGKTSLVFVFRVLGWWLRPCRTSRPPSRPPWLPTLPRTPRVRPRRRRPRPPRYLGGRQPGTSPSGSLVLRPLGR